MISNRFLFIPLAAEQLVERETWLVERKMSSIRNWTDTKEKTSTKEMRFLSGTLAACDTVIFKAIIKEMGKTFFLSLFVCLCAKVIHESRDYCSGP